MQTDDWGSYFYYNCFCLFVCFLGEKKIHVFLTSLFQQISPSFFQFLNLYFSSTVASLWTQQPHIRCLMTRCLLHCVQILATGNLVILSGTVNRNKLKPEAPLRDLFEIPLKITTSKVASKYSRLTSGASWLGASCTVCRSWQLEL